MTRTARALTLAVIAGATLAMGTYERSDAQVAALTGDQAALTAAQIDDAWARFVQRQLGGTPFTGGG